MPIRITCPRCQHSLAVPSRSAGSYATCPRCEGRVWVPKEGERGRAETLGRRETDKAAEAGRERPVAKPAVASPPVAAPPRPPSREAQGEAAAPPRSDPDAGTHAPTPAPPPVGGSPAGAPAPPPGPPAPGSGKKARLVTASAAPAGLAPAADGGLPELHLQEGRERDTTERSGTQLNPLILLVLLCASVTLSAIMILMDIEGPGGSRAAVRRDQAREVIAREYLPPPEELAEGALRLEPYQVVLREAIQAHRRGDRRTEEARYLEVLKLLRAERHPDSRGLTGSRANDVRLEEQIALLLRGG